MESLNQRCCWVVHLGAASRLDAELAGIGVGFGLPVMGAVPNEVEAGELGDDKLALGLLASGTFQMAVAGSSLLALIPAFAGMFLGQWVRDKLPQEAFRRCFFGGLVVLGAYMAFRAWELS